MAIYRHPYDYIPHQDPDVWDGPRPSFQEAFLREVDPGYAQPQQRPMDFSEALLRLKSGETVSRSGWNGKGMYLFLVRVPQAGHLDYIAMKTADGSIVPWVASHSDLLGTDWAAMVQQAIPSIH